MSQLFENIVVPLDGSEFAEHILLHLPQVATPAATVHVVTVIEPVRYAAAGLDFNTPQLVTIIREGAAEYIEKQRANLAAAGYQAKAHVVEGDATYSILELANRVDADLIAMTTHGRTGFARWALGSVAERLLQSASIPVFVVRQRTNPPNVPVQRLLVPLDGSEAAAAALPVAERWAQQTGATLVLVRAVHELDEGSRRLLFADQAAATAQMNAAYAEAEAYLKQVSTDLRTAEIASEICVILGDADKVIYNTIESEAIDAIVMSTHGRTGLQRWYYGSTTNKLLHNVECPVLLVRSYG